ncbi:MAG: 50S ribosomal protein L15 [Terriglobales bacterium]
MNLSNLRAPKRSSENRKRVGRGMGSGMGKTSTRGHKGQGSRSGSRMMRGFEGGQMPLHRRLPKRGFVNIFREEYAIVNLSELASLGESKITPDLLRSSGLVSGKNKRVKVLGDGELKSALTVQAHKFSKSAEEKIKNAGGSASIIEIKPPAPVKNRFEQARAQKRAGKQKKQA